jgi:hypothetical protein
MAVILTKLEGPTDKVKLDKELTIKLTVQLAQPTAVRTGRVALTSADKSYRLSPASVKVEIQSGHAEEVVEKDVVLTGPKPSKDITIRLEGKAGETHTAVVTVAV